MRTNSFKGSIVFRDSDKTSSMTVYSNAPIACERDLFVFRHNVLGVDTATVKNCRFLMYLRDNNGVSVSGEKFLVTDPNKLFTVFAFLSNNHGVMANPIPIITKLPRGLVMKRKEYANRTDAFHFEGFNVMLLAEMPKQIPCLN